MPARKARQGMRQRRALMHEESAQLLRRGRAAVERCADDDVARASHEAVPARAIIDGSGIGVMRSGALI